MIRSVISRLGSLLGRKSDSAVTGPDEQSVFVVEADSPIVGESGTGEKTGMVTREALGIETLGGVFTPLIPAGTQVPCAVTERFATAASRQTEISLRLCRGNDNLARRNHPLGSYTIIGIRPAHRGESQVSVTLRISEQGEVSISAEDTRTHRPMRIRTVR